MKPRIRWARNYKLPSRLKPNGAWLCTVVLPDDAWFGEVTGRGKTPQEAYRNWLNYLEIPF